MVRTSVMTIGQLSRRTGVPITILREYERRGFLYTLGRSAGNYRLFDEEALWCVQVVQSLRSLGLTLKEIQTLTVRYTERPSEPIEPLLREQVAQALARVEARIASLEALRRRVLDFQAAGASAPGCLPPQLSASPLARLLASDPRRGVGTAIS
jgi:MerR family transcriptional regulator, copper efflux regulator